VLHTSQHDFMERSLDLWAQCVHFGALAVAELAIATRPSAGWRSNESHKFYGKE
jgi:hypothetical protein